MDMVDKLLTLANQLLDLGKRNRLLNFKDQGLKSLMIWNKKTEDVFRGLKNGREFQLFNTDQALLDYKQTLNNPKFDQTKMETQEVLDLILPTMDPKMVLCYKQGYVLDKVLKSLIKDYRTSIVEKGINSLYTSFGFIKYTEDNEDYYAPLLLIPTTLTGENGVYTLSEYEDEILLNPTLKYFFSSKYDINFIDYNYEAFSTYVSKIKDILPEGTSFVDGAALGIYSFYKMNMYNDIIQNKEIVVQNENIRRILGDDSFFLDDSKELPIYPVVNCDSSQLEAIKLAAQGKSFCLQGPPGSGKSQTITNIISTLLGNGKKILFVSEKIAALRVVFENLRRAGLSEFAIEIHSNKTNKKEFIDDLYQTAIKPKYDIKMQTKLLGANYDSLKAHLRNYEKELYTVIPGLQINLLELYSKYLEIDIEPCDITFNVKDLNLYDLEKIDNCLKHYVTYSYTLGYDYRKNPLYGISVVPQNYVSYQLDDDIDDAKEHIEFMLSLQEVFNENGYTDMKLSDMYKYLPLFNIFTKLKTFSPLYLKKQTRLKLQEAIKNYMASTRNMNAEVLKLYNKDVLSLNLEQIYEDINSNNKGLFKNKTYKNAIDELLKYRNNKTKADVLLEDLKELISLKKTIAISTALSNNVYKMLGGVKSSDLRGILVDLQTCEGLDDFEVSNEFYLGVTSLFTDNSIYLKFLKEKDAFYHLFNMLYGNLITDDYTLEELKDIVLMIEENKNDVPTFLDQLDVVNTLEKYGVLSYLNDYIDKEYDIDYISKMFNKLFYKQYVELVVKNSPSLKNFSSEQKDEVIANFIVLDEKILNINRDHIISLNSLNRPDETLIEGSSFKLLDKEYQKARRQMAIRSLLEEIFELALDVKPVFLMSPLSVSTYLACKKDMFDCVVFDEASQIFACDALGSIYRAKQCIVIGDKKQMPPTSFFQVGVDDIPEEFDSESILDKASQIFYTASLKWHYRSRSEELITFSNDSFYNGGLITVPQAKEHTKGFGIDFYYLPDGRYDTKTRTNPIEAQTVCDMVFEHYKNSNESLGVVAFSNVQAELINDLIERRLKKEPEYRELFTANEEEPLFVKNLESVQGDERDRIIFSIAYGFNQENKFYLRFGPLNGSGGERRLNVAITRAKFNVSVVSSIKADDIDCSLTNSLGVHLLHDYLNFAEHVTTKKNYIDTTNGVISSVKAFLEQHGYEAYPNFGASSFKIDIAVKKDDEFILAIMIDCKNDYSSNLTDRYRLEKLLLERRGWHYFKLYTTSWFNNETEEKLRLERALEGEETISDIENKLIESSYLVENDDSTKLESNFEDYQAINIERCKEFLQFRDIEYVVREIIHIESPIHEELLCKKIASILDKTRVTPQIKETVLKAIPSSVTKKGDFYFDKPNQEIHLRLNSDRDVQYIHPLELEDGIITIVNKNNGVLYDGVVKAMAQLLGLAKITPKLKTSVCEILDQLIKSGRLVKKNDCLFNGE